jgi:hypothetical protein
MSRPSPAIKDLESSPGPADLDERRPQSQRSKGCRRRRRSPIWTTSDRRLIAERHPHLSLSRHADPDRLRLLIGTHYSAPMPSLESTGSSPHPGSSPGPSIKAKRSLDAGRVYSEIVLPDNVPAAREPNVSRAKPENPSCSCPTSGRNLVVCIDGTANQFSEKASRFYRPSCRRALMLARIRMSSSSIVGSSKMIHSSRTTIAGLGRTSESPRLLFVI